MTFERMVLIDDNETDNFFHCIALKKAAFAGEVHVFERPAEGLEFLLQDPMEIPTCVLLDINMPGISGFEVAQTLLERLRPKAAFRLLMLTSSNWTDDRLRAEAIPLVKGFLVKPLTAEMVHAIMAEPVS